MSTFPGHDLEQQTEPPRGGSRMAWGGRFSAAPDELLQAFNASIDVDIRMAREDIRGSIAHVRMLGRQQIVGADDAAAIEAGLWSIIGEVDRGEFALTVADEDVHTGVERRLRELIGAASGRLHTGRSRNDQVANDFRLWTRRALVDIAGGLETMISSLVDVAAAHEDVVMPGFTHLQHAQPVLLAHHLHAYAEMFLRDCDRVQDAYRRTDVLVLGSGALAGTSYPLNRQFVANDLGFARVSANSLDGVSDRDFALDTLFACSTIALHFSRLSEELILWSSGEFRFITLSDAFSTGSSIMPQKKNADVAELARGKSGRIFGDLVGLLTIIKGLPLAYNKDLQEDKEGVFDAVDTVLTLLDIFPPMLLSTTFDRDRLAEMAIADFSLATDAADVLARHGVPFREAHGVVGALVATCVADGKTFADLSDTEWASIHPVFARQRPPLDALSSVNSRDIPGGTAGNRVRDALDVTTAQLSEIRIWIATHRRTLDRLFESVPNHS